jgi:hypothetical protein
LRERLGHALANGRKAAERGCEATAAPAELEEAPVAGIAPNVDASCAASSSHAGAALSRKDSDEAPMPKGTHSAANEKAAAEVEKLKVPTDPAALLDGTSYVRAVAQHVDLVAASARLVVSLDEKISKAELDRLRELIFGKGGPQFMEDPEAPHVDFTGFPRPIREPRPQSESAEISGGDQSDHS